MFQPGRFFRGILIAAVASAPSAIAWAASGSEIFADVCAACHGAAGEGKASLAPPLKGSAFVKSSSADAIAAVIKNGRTGAAKKYPDIPQGMPAQPVYDDDLDAVVKYVKENLQK